MTYRVAVAGATGVVGRELLKTLAERNFPTAQVVALVPGRSGGTELSYGEDQVLKVQSVDRFDFAGINLAFFATDATVSAAHAPRAAKAGAMTIDLSGRFHLEPDVPLLVPEVNPHALARAAKRRMAATPLPAATLLAMALKPLHALAPVKRVVVTVLQPVSAAGKSAMDELWSQTRGTFVNEMPPAEQLPKQIAFNVIPHVDAFRDDGPTHEEWALPLELRKLLDPDIQAQATSVRVPVFIGLSLSVAAEFAAPIDEAAAREALRESPGLVLFDRRDDAGYVTPVDCVGEDAVYVSRLRRDASVEHGLAFWCAADNLRKGSALNAVQVAELMHERGLLAG